MDTSREIHALRGQPPLHRSTQAADGSITSAKSSSLLSGYPPDLAARCLAAARAEAREELTRHRTRLERWEQDLSARENRLRLGVMKSHARTPASQSPGGSSDTITRPQAVPPPVPPSTMPRERQVATSGARPPHSSSSVNHTVSRAPKSKTSGSRRAQVQQSH